LKADLILKDDGRDRVIPRAGSSIRKTGGLIKKDHLHCGGIVPKQHTQWWEVMGKIESSP